jgi:Ca-activated chloride channel family protein
MSDAFAPRRSRVLVWIVTCVALLGLLFWAYRRFVLQHPDPTLSWSRDGVTYELLDPKMLGAALLAPWFLVVIARSLADLPLAQRILSLVLRVAFVALLALGLSRLVRTASTQKVCTVFLVDVSDSVPDEALADARGVIERAWKDRPEDALVRVVTFARRPIVVGQTDGVEVDAPPPEITRHTGADAGAGSNVEAALGLAYGLFPPGFVKRAVLLTDGVETDGDMVSEAGRARDFGIRVHVVPYTRPAPAEVAVRQLRLPERVKVGETFEVHADVYATRPTRARARLFQGETLNGLDGVREVDLVPGENDLVWKSVVRLAGPVTYAFELEPIGPDKFAENNRFATTIDVPGRPSVLYIEGTPEHAGPFSSALTAQQLDVDVRPAVGMPTSLKELERYDFLVLSDVSKDQISLQGQELVEQYVRDLGGGFLFAGGEQGFGLGGWYNTTIERILPVRMENERKKEMPSVAMMVVLDRSGSMNGLPLEMAKAAAKATVGILSPDDLVGVIAFDSSPTRYVKLQPARNRSRIGGDIARIQPGGGTEIFGALDAAYQDMTVTQARKKHVILLTDGKAPTSGIRDLVSAMVAESITVTTVGFGGDVDERLLKMIADVGGGRYHPVTDPNNLPRIFTKETEMIARAAAVEEWFPVVQTGTRVVPAQHRHSHRAEPARLRLHQDEADARGRAARQRHGRAHPRALACGPRLEPGVDERREVALGRGVAALARLGALLGAARARAHAPETPPRARHEGRGDLRRGGRHGGRVWSGRALRERLRLEARGEGARARRGRAHLPVPTDRARSLRGPRSAREVRLVSARRRARQGGRRRHAPPRGGELGPRHQPLSPRIRELRAGPREARAGRCHDRRPTRERSPRRARCVRCRRRARVVPRAPLVALRDRGDRRVLARPVRPPRAALRP